MASSRALVLANLPARSVHLRNRSLRLGDCLQVSSDHYFTAAAVGFLDALADFLQSLFGWQHPRENEETSLHHGVDAATEAHFARYGGCVDDPELQFLLENVTLHVSR